MKAHGHWNRMNLVDAIIECRRRALRVVNSVVLLRSAFIKRSKVEIANSLSNCTIKFAIPYKQATSREHPITIAPVSP